MAILLSKTGRVELARSIYRDIKTDLDSYFFALGKTDAWADEENPDTPLGSEEYLKEFRRNLIFAQRVSSADISHLVRREDWESGTVYDPYDDAYSAVSPANSGATSLADANFYVITDELKVFKCLDNNSNSPSTIKPKSDGAVALDSLDGYKWKFLFQLSAADENKFLDAGHFPVRKVTGNPEHDVNGEIDTVTKVSGGSGYTSAPHVNINGDGTGAVVTATVVAGEVTALVIEEPGYGYSFAFITFSGGGGTGADYTVTLGDDDPLPSLQKFVEEGAIPGTVDRIIVNSGGQNYLAGDLVITITGDGTGATAEADIASGIITKIRVTSAGTGYTFANVTFSGAQGINASARAVVSPINGHGSNPVKELFASTIGITTSLSDSDSSNTDLFLNNDFRQIGLIKNFSTYNDMEVKYTDLTGTALHIINVDDGSSYAADDLITTSDGSQFRVIQIIEGLNGQAGTFNVHLQSIIVTSSFDKTSTLDNTTKGTTGLSINNVNVTEPEINKFSGDIVYIENRRSIGRSSDQVETIKALINF